MVSIRHAGQSGESPAESPEIQSPHSPAELDALRALGNSAPVARLIGMDICVLTPGRAEVILPFHAGILQAHGRVHGGLFGLLVDTAGYFAAASLQASEGVTIEYKLNLLEAVTDQGLRAVARVIRSGRSISLCDVDVYRDDGTLVGKGLATYRFFSKR